MTSKQHAFFAAPPAAWRALHLRKERLYEKTGTIVLEYDIVRT